MSYNFVPTAGSRVSLSGQALWVDDEKNVMYCFGGDNPESEVNDPPPSDSIWGFTPNGNGGGQWTEILGLSSEQPFPSDIHGTSSGMFVSDDHTAYYLGGFISSRTSPSTSVSVSNQFNNTGLLTLDFETLTLKNSSELGRPWRGGALLNVPIYGSDGVLVAIGGGSLEKGAGFDNIYVFDKKEHRWHTQIAEEDLPRPRFNFCAVGVHGKGYTNFEM